jgi:uncharacterized cupredoxin-like copper-binding protein
VKRTAVAAAILALVATACGGAHGQHSDNAASQTIDVEMVDLAFKPATFTAHPGERVRFVFHNRGAVAHDAFIGDSAAQAEHERVMRAGMQDSGGHDMHGGEANAITVDPGKSGELTYAFDRTGTVEIGCHQPGHYAAGMKLAVTVARATTRTALRPPGLSGSVYGAYPRGVRYGGGD